MMILRTHALLCLPLLLASPALAGDDDGARADVVHRTYSLPGPRGGAARATWARTLPLKRNWESLSFDHEIPSIGPDSIIDLITNSVTPAEWEYENRSIQTDPRGNLVIAATPEAHAQIVKLLDYLDAVLSANTRVRVDIYDAKRMLPASFGGTLPAARADALLQEALAGGAISGPTTVSIDILPQRLARGGGMEEIRFARDFDVEIAQASATLDPVIDALQVGFEIQARSARVGNGSALQLVLRMGALLEEMRTLECPLYREISVSDKNMERDVLKGSLDQPTVGFATLGFTTYLPDGQDLVAVVESENVFGRFARVVRLRAVSDAVPAFVELGGGQFSWADLALVSMPEIEHNEEGLMSGLVTGEHLEGGMLSIAPSTSFDTDWMVDYVRMQLPDFDDRQGNLIGTFGSGIAMFSDARSQATFRKALGELTAAFASAGDLDLRLTNRGGDGTFARATLSTIAGVPVWFSLGGQQWNVIGYDVEVAQSASINDPHADAVTDGMIARISTRPLANDWRIDLDAALHLQRSKPRMHEVGAWPGTVALTRALQSEVGESFRLGAGKTHAIGDLDPAGERGLQVHVSRR